MPRVRLSQLAYARSGDKGDGSNVGIIAYTPEAYAFLEKELTVERMKDHFGDICFGDIVRYEVPNLLAFNFILHDSLGGGGSESLKTDAQGKTHGLGALYLELDLPEGFPLPERGRS
ncbi:MAG: hypothetical protein V3W41_08175 [Planctomycetota bacterium]